MRAVRYTRFLLSFSRRWLMVVIVAVGIYATLPLATPVMMQVGLEGPARALYTLYAPFCHQFGFRSFFMFGEQAAYPRAITGTTLTPFEAAVVDDPEFLSSYSFYYARYNSGQIPSPPTVEELVATWSPWFQFASKDFIGNAEMGYKNTLCERDVAIYLSIFAGALIFAIPNVRRRLRPVPIWLYLLLGIVPIAIDGFSQLLGYPPFSLWPPRETLPQFRVVTGFLFGMMNAWLALPYLNRSMEQTRLEMELKLRRAGFTP